MTYSVISPEQSLFDIAIQVYGDVMGVHWLIEDNRATISNLTERLRAGQQLTLRADRINARQETHLGDFAPFLTIKEEDRPEGIDFWYLDEFVVQ